MVRDDLTAEFILQSQKHLLEEPSWDSGRGFAWIAWYLGQTGRKTPETGQDGAGIKPW